ncbi:hypothetical protein OUY22_22985, partial [Nonomuraea sp. MCN248]|nr:hypothetical protein [Nonomuraea corallina]
LDPVGVHGLLADLAPELADLARGAVGDLDVPLSGGAEQGGGTPERYDWGALAAPSAPALDLLAERHARATVRLFVS